MAVYRFEDPGIKDSMDALAGIMRAAGEYSRQKQDHEMKMNMLRVASDPTLNPEAKIQGIYEEVANYKQAPRSGIGGVAQRVGNFFAPPSQIPDALSNNLIQDVLNRGDLTRQTAMDKIVNSRFDALSRQNTAEANSIARLLSTMDPKSPDYTTLRSEYNSRMGIPDPPPAVDAGITPAVDAGITPAQEGGGVKDWGVWPWNWGGGDTPQKLAANQSPTVQNDSRTGTPSAFNFPTATKRSGETPQKLVEAEQNDLANKAEAQAPTVKAAQPKYKAPAPKESSRVSSLSRVNKLANKMGLNGTKLIKNNQDMYDALLSKMVQYDIPDEAIIDFINENKD